MTLFPYTTLFRSYTYDANGNLVYINTSRVKRDGKEDEKASEQKFRWDEENRLLAADENGFVSNYWYDADGERTVKTSGENEAIYVNSEFSGGNTSTARFSLYVSPYLVAGQGGKYTKHIYIGSQRIVSKLGDLASYGADPRRIPYAGNEADGLTINYKDKYNQQLQSIKDNYKTFDLPYNGKDNDDYVNGQGFCCNDDTPEAAQARTMNASTRSAVDNNFHDKDNYEKMQFYYHPDHLGSSSYITNLDGEVAQHIEYVPFGEVFIEERNNTWNTPYLFNAKEFDEETGMYYYGARYYEPRLSLWMSCDPLQEKNPNMCSYVYCINNPTRYIDPTGMIWEDPKKSESLKRSINNRIESINKNTSKLKSEIETGKGRFLFWSYKLNDNQITNRRDKISENGQKIELLKQSLADIETIGKASDTYRLTGPSKNDGTHGVIRGKDGVINIEGSNQGLHIHEIRHIGQSIAAGGLRFKEGQLLNSASTLEGRRNNEINAYQTQYSFDGTYPAGAHSLKDINHETLMNIRTPEGKEVYGNLKDKTK